VVIRDWGGLLGLPLLREHQGNPKDPAVPYMMKAREVLKNWFKPAIVIFSDKDPIMSGACKWFYHNIPTAKAQEK